MSLPEYAVAAVGDESRRAAVEELIQTRGLGEIEISWPDQQGHARGKRVPSTGFLDRSDGSGFAFCDAALCWDVSGDVIDGARLSGWATGYPDLIARADLDTFRVLPWRDGVGHVIADVYDHHGARIRTAPRSVLRRAIERLASLGLQARVGVEIEFYLLDQDGRHLADGVQCYSLQKANEMDPVFGSILDGLRGFVDVDGGNTEYGPGQVEFNLNHAPPLEAADDAFRFKYAARELARRAGATATFMAKPFAGISGSSQHLHISLWQDDEPVFGWADGAEETLFRHAIGGVLAHLPGITLYGGPTVNSYKRFEPDSFAPTTVSWGIDNRTASVRSLLETPNATRLELRTGAADAEPHWAIASLLAAVTLGLEHAIDPGERGDGNLYGDGAPLPTTLDEAIRAAEADEQIVEILGADAVHDYAAIARSEWRAFVTQVTDWDRNRYLTGI
jgi:glutamine synthetase